MGSSCSRLGSSRPSRSRDYRTNRSKFCSLFCGASSSRAIHQMEDSMVQFLVHPVEHQHCNHNIDELQLPTNGSIRMGQSAYSENDIAVSEEQCAVDDINVHGKRVSHNKELAPLPQVSADYSHEESRSYSNASNGTSCKGHQSSEPVCMKVMFAASSSTTQEIGDSCSDELTGCIQEDEATAYQNPDSESSPCRPDLSLTFQSLGDESLQEVPSSLDTLVSDDREVGQGDVDMVGVSSNVLSTSSTDASNLEARRNSRRLFWDAFSRRSFRRHSESPFVFPSNSFSNTGDQDRWLLDISGDFIDDEASGDSRRFSSRIHVLNEQQRNSRSQVQLWERIRSSLSENSRQNLPCPSGIHPNGACSCDSFSRVEHSSTRASISRIIMLAEALFEVLDEIHGQPVSLALSMVSLPAPESVVDSFPLKNHEKKTNGGDEIEQCYICLADYEDGDKIRVLPCHHEYHMSCVDKWLKEIHGVCPLCRGDVRAGTNDECSISNLEIPTTI
ncbi:E3 ubiquitin-protein ligase RNF12-B-like isoform X1 [Cucurbita moschata]|uniref:E3 ubiquitin-protein ligase RNF12-B-like isoform X1 n=2 Tax=Cucurbita TaxID=3660 RepID=A0A6J1EVR4_CUCMO|nr:E3 ubiquitin-protein ligase RNF12-B-like isoform X1 [Cucurbita moschata]